MSSFHRADWLSLAQTVSSTLAILGAFGVVFLQDRLHERRQRRDYDTQAAELVQLAGGIVSNGFIFVTVALEHRYNAENVDTPADREKHSHELAVCVDALASLPLERFPTGESGRMVTRARSLLSDAVRIIRSAGPEATVQCGPEYGEPLRVIQERLQRVMKNIYGAKALAPHAVQKVMKLPPDEVRKLRRMQRAAKWRGLLLKLMRTRTTERTPK